MIQRAASSGERDAVARRGAGVTLEAGSAARLPGGCSQWEGGCHRREGGRGRVEGCGGPVDGHGVKAPWMVR